MKDPILTPKQMEELAAVIADVERHTTGEVRLMIVSRSVGGLHVPVLLALALAVLGCSVLPWPLHLHWWILPSILLAAFVLAIPLARLPGLQRLLIPLHDQRQATRLRAELEFYREGLGATRGKTGILLFLSRFERQVVVLADSGISKHLPESTWEGVVQKILEGARQRDWVPKLTEAIRICAAHLAQHFPAEGESLNELPNAVIIKD